MKPGYAALISLVQSATELPFADCFTFTLLDGTVLRYTDLDVPVWLNGNYFAANAVRVQGLKFKQTTGVDIDEQTIDVIASASDTIKGVPFLQAVRERVLDGCTVQRERAFFNPATGWPPDPINGATAAGGVTLFKGRVADITALGRTCATINVKSELVLLDMDFPRNLWQPSCLHTLYDSGCKLNRGAYQGAGSAGAGATDVVIPFANGGAGAVLHVSMAGSEGAPLSRVLLTSSAAVNSSYTTAPAVTVTDPTGTGAIVKAVMSPFHAFGFGMYALSVVAPGSGYTNPVISFSGGGGTGATAEAVLKAGAQSVSGISVAAGGTEYSAAAQIVLSGGGGSGAAAVPIISGGVITGATVTAAGTGYSSAPTAAVVDQITQNYAQGTLMFQSGQNAGVLAQIKTADATTVTLAQPLDYVPVAGDVFSIWPGCDHTRGPGGCAKFNNLGNFRGYPFVPPPEVAY